MCETTVIMSSTYCALFRILKCNSSAEWNSMAMATKVSKKAIYEARKKAISESTQAIGIDELKPEQFRAMDSILRGEDTFVSLPTGYGKSVIYAALPLAFDKLYGLLR